MGDRVQVTEPDFYLTSPDGGRVAFTLIAVAGPEGLPIVVAVPSSLPKDWTEGDTENYFKEAAAKLREIAATMEAPDA